MAQVDYQLPVEIYFAGENLFIATPYKYPVHELETNDSVYKSLL